MRATNLRELMPDFRIFKKKGGVYEKVACPLFYPLITAIGLNLATFLERPALSTIFTT